MASYVRSTAPSEKTDTNQIQYWRDQTLANRASLLSYGLKINGTMLGFAQLRYVSATNDNKFMHF